MTRHSLGSLVLALAAWSTGAAQDSGRPAIDQLQSVVPAIGTGEAPVWSADGASLLYLGGTDGGLWTVGADGGRPTRLADALGGATQLRRSPDGRMVTYVKSVLGGAGMVDVIVGRQPVSHLGQRDSHPDEVRLEGFEHPGPAEVHQQA